MRWSLAHCSRRVGRSQHAKLESLVKWLGYGAKHNTWDPELHVQNAPDRLADYWTALQPRDLSVPASRATKAIKYILI